MNQRHGLVLLLLMAAGLRAGEWTAPVEATDRAGNILVTCRARIAGDFLLVEVEPVDGWHVYAMDNEQRAMAALAGRTSLGVEENTEVIVRDGLELVGNWLQTEPDDFSQPELRWYSYGFEGRSLLASQVRRTGAGPATVELRAQACDSASCVRVDAEMRLSLTGLAGGAFDPKGLVQVGMSQ